MRVLPVAMCAALALAGAACTKSDDTSTANSSATAAAAAASAVAAAATAAAAAATAAAASGGTAVAGAGDDAKTGLPLYPGATVQSSAESNGQAGTVLSTTDSFDKVYDWYKGKMPAGSEKAKLSAGGMSTASFQIDQNGGKGTVVITTRAGATSIALAHTTGVKM